jgi:hypothetical protein
MLDGDSSGTSDGARDMASEKGYTLGLVEGT